MKFATLYKKTKTGAIQCWSIEADGDQMITRHGQVDGAMQETRDTVKRAKSAESIAEQAMAEAAAKHLGKKKKGYVDSLAAAQAGKLDAAITGGILPMLAYAYEKVTEHLVFPAYVQPKLDGHRCVGEPAGLWGRTRKPVNSVPHIEEAVAELGLPWLDGELYNHDLHAEFEKLTSILRKQEPAPGHEIVQFHVYDLPGPGTFAQRAAAMERLKPRLVGTPIRIVETILVNNETEMWAAHERFKKMGYEGAIVRNAAGLYENFRSVNLMKLKDFIDAEFKIVGLDEGRGKLQGHCGSFICELPGGATFNAKMNGDLAFLKTVWENKSAWIGKMLTVKYQGLTSAGVPRFPVGLRERVDIGTDPATAKPKGLAWAKVSTK